MTPNEMSLLYIWGHGYQLDDSNKAKTQTVYETIANKSDTWYATNIEIADYLTAVNRLVTDITDDKVTGVTNPSDISVWGVLADNQPFEIRAGETKYFVSKGGAGTEITFTDPCDANPLNSDRLLENIENGIGQGTVPDSYSGENDTAYSRYNMESGRVHSLIYKVSDTSYDVSAFKIRTYRHASRGGTFHIYASPDNVAYSEVEYTSTQLGDRNDWWTYRYDLENAAPIPAGTKYIKIAFPTDFEAATNDDVNANLVGNVELTFIKPATASVIEESPADVPSLLASYPSDKSVNNELDDDILLVFDKAMNTASVISGVTVDKASITNIIPSADGKSFIVKPDATLAPDTEYKISLSDSITDTTGNKIVPKAISFRTKNVLSGTINDTANDYRYVYETGGSQDVFTGVGGTYNVAFARTAADTAESTSYVVYRAPYGEFGSFDIQLYRNKGACVNPFTVYASSDNASYTKVTDDTEGVETAAIEKGYVPIRLTNTSLPKGTRYIKIAFPEYSETDANAHHMAQISDVVLTYTTDKTNTSFAHIDMFNVDTANQNQIGHAASIENVTSKTALLNIDIRNLLPQYSGTNATLIFAVYTGDGTNISNIITKNITVPDTGNALYVDQIISFDDKDSLSDCKIKCYIWDSLSELSPIGEYRIVE